MIVLILLMWGRLLRVVALILVSFLMFGVFLLMFLLARVLARLPAIRAFSVLMVWLRVRHLLFIDLLLLRG